MAWILTKVNIVITEPTDLTMKSKKINKNTLHKLRLSAQREIQKAEGFFDGRFVERKEESAKKYKRNLKHRKHGF